MKIATETPTNGLCVGHGNIFKVLNEVNADNLNNVYNPLNEEATWRLHWHKDIEADNNTSDIRSCRAMQLPYTWEMCF